MLFGAMLGRGAMNKHPLRWSDPDERAVAEDALLEAGRPRPPLPPYSGPFERFLVRGARWPPGGAPSGGNGDGYGSDGDGYGDGGYGVDGDGDGGGDGGGGDGGGYGGSGGYVGCATNSIKENAEMRHGLAIVCSPAGYGPYVRIGWCRRVDGDEWEIVNARVVRRFGTGGELAKLAVDGPLTDTQLLSAAATPSPIHRLHAIRYEAASESAWAEHCPRPHGWTDEEGERR